MKGKMRVNGDGVYHIWASAGVILRLYPMKLHFAAESFLIPLIVWELSGAVHLPADKNEI